MNGFGTRLEAKPHLIQLAREVCDALGCKQTLTLAFVQVAFVAIRVFDHKQSKYGPGNIAEFGETGVLIRATDKIKRLTNLWRTGQEPMDETVEDSYGDLANYGIIALMCRWGLWPGVQGRNKRNESVEVGKEAVVCQK